MSNNDLLHTNQLIRILADLSNHRISLVPAIEKVLADSMIDLEKKIIKELHNYYWFQ